MTTTRVSLWKRLTHEQGYRTAERIAAAHGIELYELRRYASDRLADELREWLGEDHGHGIGSSDTSGKLSSIANYEPLELVREARAIRDRNELLDSIAAASGRTRNETLAGLRALLAPA